MNQLSREKDQAFDREVGPSIGALLRASRERCGEDLGDVADMLRIRYPYLLAIEEGRFSELPGKTYAIGFVRTYAEHLGLDADEVVRRFKDESSGIEGSVDLHFPSPVPESTFPTGAVLAIGLIVAGLAYGGWQLNSSRESSVADLIAPLPDRLMAMLPGGEKAELPPPTPMPDDASALTTAAAAPPPQTAAIEAPETSVPTTPEQAIPAPTTVAALPATPPQPPADTISETAAEAAGDGNDDAEAVPPPPDNLSPAITIQATPPVAPQAMVPPAPPRTDDPAAQQFGAGGKFRILVRARSDSWIQVRDQTGNELIVTRLLRAGDSYRVPNRNDLTLQTGNAGALEILVDGEIVPSIGPEGAVRRRVALSAQRLLDGTAVVE